MKRCLAFLICALLLCGCGAGLDDPAETEMTVLQEPPPLRITAGEQQWEVPFSGCSWQFRKTKDTKGGLQADVAHPLDCKNILDPMYLAQGEITLSFPYAADTVSVRCWEDTQWGNLEAEAQTLPVTDGKIQPVSGGYIYEITAVWSSFQGFSGQASYYLYAVTDHAHSVPLSPQTVEDPVTGYCGNTETKVFWNDMEYLIAGSDSIVLTDLVINLRYDPEQVCRCMGELGITTEDGMQYTVNLSEAFVRCDAGQAALTREQADAVAAVLDRLTIED